MPDGFYYMSDVKDYIDYTIKKHESLTTTPSIHVYINKINYTLLSNIKDGYILELHTSNTMKLLRCTKN